MNSPVERINLTLNELEFMEKDILIRRQYGTYLLSKNPDIKKICGIDISPDAINGHLQLNEMTVFIK